MYLLAQLCAFCKCVSILMQLCHFFYRNCYIRGYFYSATPQLSTSTTVHIFAIRLNNFKTTWSVSCSRSTGIFYAVPLCYLFTVQPSDWNSRLANVKKGIFVPTKIMNKNANASEFQWNGKKLKGFKHDVMPSLASCVMPAASSTSLGWWTGYRF